MIYRLKFKDKEETFCSWTPSNAFCEFLKKALEHNMPNLRYPIESCFENIFQNIVDELRFLKETDRAVSIHNDNVDVIFEMLYHNNFGLMFEGSGKLYLHPKRVYLQK